jgi:hypothetical protein
MSPLKRGHSVRHPKGSAFLVENTPLKVGKATPFGADGPPSGRLQGASPLLSPLMGSPNAYMASPRGNLGGIQEYDTDALRADVIQYLASLVGLSCDASTIGTLFCDSNTTELSIYNAFSAVLLQTAAPTDTAGSPNRLQAATLKLETGLQIPNSIASSAAATVHSTATAAANTPYTVTPTLGTKPAGAAAMITSVPDSGKGTGIQRNVNPMDVTGRKPANPPATRGFPDMSSIADTIIKSVVSAAKYVSGNGGDATALSSDPSILQSSDITEESRSAGVARAKAVAVPEIRVLLLHELHNASSSVQRLVKDILNKKAIPRAALIQYAEESKHANQLRGQFAARQTRGGLDPYAALPWWHIASTAEKITPTSGAAFIDGQDSFILTNSAQLRQELKGAEIASWAVRSPWSLIPAGSMGRLNSNGEDTGNWASAGAAAATATRTRGTNTAIRRVPSSSFSGGALPGGVVPPYMSPTAATRRSTKQQPFAEALEEEYQPVSQAVANSIYPVPGIAAKYILQAGTLPPPPGLDASYSISTASADGKQASIASSGAHGSVQWTCSLDSAWVDLPAGFLVIIVSDAPLPSEDSHLARWDELLNDHTRAFAEKLGYSPETIARVIPPSVQCNDVKLLSPLLQQETMLHITLDAHVANSEITEALQSQAAIGGTPGRPHHRLRSAGTSSFTSHISEVLSPRRCLEVATALARTERSRWMKPFSGTMLGRLTDVSTGAQSVVLSDHVRDLISESTLSLQRTLVPRVPQLSLCMHSVSDVDASLVMLLEQLWSPESLSSDPLSSLAEYRTVLGRLVKPPSTLGDTADITVFLQPSALPQRVTAAVRAQAALEGRPYATSDDLYAVLWSCCVPVTAVSENT